MITSADIAAALKARWDLAGLDGQIGAIRSGRLSAQQPGQTTVGTPRTLPYVQLEVTAGGAPEFETEGVYVGRWLAKLTLYGVGEQAVGDSLRAATEALGKQDWTITPASRGTFMSAFPGNPALEPDEDTKGAEDVWQGTVAYEVTAGGIL